MAFVVIMGPPHHRSAGHGVVVALQALGRPRRDWPYSKCSRAPWFPDSASLIGQQYFSSMGVFSHTPRGMVESTVFSSSIGILSRILRLSSAQLRTWRRWKMDITTCGTLCLVARYQDPVGWLPCAAPLSETREPRTTVQWRGSLR